MRILVTGADGFLGRRVVDKLLQAGHIGDGFVPFSQLLLMDLKLARRLDDARVVPLVGSFVDATARALALAGGVDVLFHLASLPGGAAQANYDLGRAVNLEGALALMDALCVRTDSPCRAAPIVVYASSIAALAPTHGQPVTEDTPLRPRGSYGCHKVMLELHLADLTARGWLDARSVRPAGIVPRPREAFAGFATAWMSGVFHAIANGEPFELPLPREASTWLQSVDCVADNVLLAARLPAAGLAAHRAWTLPALNPRMDELVQAIALQAGAAGPPAIGFAEPPASGLLPGLPAQHLPLTEALGFHHDGTLATLVQRALADVRRQQPASRPG